MGLPAPHVTASEDELCFEWWVGGRKVTLYAKPTTIFRDHGAEEADPPTPERLLEWLAELGRAAV